MAPVLELVHIDWVLIFQKLQLDEDVNELLCRETGCQIVGRMGTCPGIDRWVLLDLPKRKKKKIWSVGFR